VRKVTSILASESELEMVVLFWDGYRSLAHSYILLAMSKRRLIIAVMTLVIVGFAGWYFLIRDTEESSTAQNTQSSAQSNQSNDDTSTTSSANEIDKNKYSVSEPGSPWWVVNKKRPLPAGYVPPDLVVPAVKLRLVASAEQMQFSKSAESALIKMFAAAAKDKITLVFGSGYRSEALQRQFYNQYVNQSGQQAADTFSARPGTSEHQTGLSFDVTSANGACHLETCFKDTPEGKWVATNGYKYGFIIRYPDGKTSITGYQYEPWHLRYVGTELATEMKRTGVQTMEEFFDLSPAPSY
jgi:D-alanyl-D-alanine carboxypeptidase